MIRNLNKVRLEGVMNISIPLSGMALAVCAFFPVSSSAQGSKTVADQPKVLVELFSSLNCGACPKANANLIHLSQDSNIMPITWSVSYWDYLGSKDPNARPEFLKRQRAYADYFNLRGPYTPQAVIDGCAQNTGLSEESVARKIALVKSEADLGVSIRFSKSGFDISTRQTARPSTVWLAGYRPGITQLVPTKGSNAGKTMDHVNLATSIQSLGDWDGVELAHFDASCTAPACLVIVQESGTAEILSIGVMPAVAKPAEG